MLPERLQLVLIGTGRVGDCWRDETFHLHIGVKLNHKAEGLAGEVLPRHRPGRGKVDRD